MDRNFRKSSTPVRFTCPQLWPFVTLALCVSLWAGIVVVALWLMPFL